VYSKRLDRFGKPRNWVSKREKMHLLHRLNTFGSACGEDGE
jgi:hypothetical protein